MMPLVYDRTDSDVQQARVILASGRNAAERLKGCYDHVDRNRVGLAVNELAAWMRINGYRTNARGLTDWRQDSMVTRQRGEMLLESVAAVRRDFVTFLDTPRLPDSLFVMNHHNANALERVLADLQEMVSWIERNRDMYFSDITFYQ
ncbi:MAG: hypothetical protein FWE06_07995 [Oscillospiraceae bacterium]|nr:hypothetical protein [Oscillospiraceae bacterium]